MTLLPVAPHGVGGVTDVGHRRFNEWGLEVYLGSERVFLY